MSRELLTANAIAEALGMDRRSVMLRLGDISPDGEVHGRPAWTLKTFWKANTERHADAAGTSNGNGAADNGHGSYSAERARLTREKAMIAEMERKRLEGELAPVEQFGMVARAIADVVRTRLLAVPSQVGARWGMVHNAIEAKHLVECEIKAALEELSRIEVGVGNGDGQRV